MSALVAALACVFGLAGCGGSGPSGSVDATTTSAQKTPAPEGTLEALWQSLGGEPVGMVAGTSDYGVGTNRISFLVVNSKSELIEAPTARVWVSRGLRQKPFAETTATLIPVGVPGGAQADAQNVYVATVDTPKPGKYWLLAQPVGSKAIQALGDMVVRKHPVAPAVGEKAFPSLNPTLRPGAKPSTVTTAEPPDRELLRTTVAAAMAAKRPFVVTFATPQYCQTRTCGPVVQVVQSVAREWQGAGIDFIHIEIYEGNDPSRGVNRWVDEWKLPTEPFTFVVDRNGVIRQRFEGAFGAEELERAVRKVAGRS